MLAAHFATATFFLVDEISLHLNFQQFYSVGDRLCYFTRLITCMCVEPLMGVWFITCLTRAVLMLRWLTSRLLQAIRRNLQL